MSRTKTESDQEKKREAIKAYFLPDKPTLLGIELRKEDWWWPKKIKPMVGSMILGLIGVIFLGFAILYSSKANQYDNKLYTSYGSTYYDNSPEEDRLRGYAVWAGFITFILLTISLTLFIKSINRYSSQQSQYRRIASNWGILKKEVTRPSGEQIDEWFREDVSSIVKRALDKLDINPPYVRDPLVIVGPVFWHVPGISGDEIVVSKDQNKKLRFSINKIVVICLTEERVATYAANFNFLRYAFASESTVEYLYNDIVSVSTEERSTDYNLPNGKVLRIAQFFRLVVPSGDNIEVAISSPEIQDLLEGELPPNDHEKVVKAIRSMLRQKKGNPNQY